MKHLEKQDPEVYHLIQQELQRQREGLVMIPSENFTSPAVLEATGSVLTNKYAEGYPFKRYYTGNQFIDQVEQLAIDRAKELFGAEHANVQPNAGSPANMACYMATLEIGDKIMAMDLAQGGHLTHGSPVNFSGKLYQFIHYGVRKDTEMLDMEEIRQLAQREKPKLILSGYTAYPRAIDFTKFAEIAHEIGAVAMADISHIVGLCLSGVLQNPVPSHDLVMTTTHKTLRGPRSAIILCKEKYAKAIDKTVFPGLQGGPLEHVIAAKAVAFVEAMKPEFKEYCQQIAKNARALAETLLTENLRLVSGGTDNHLILIDCTNLGITGKEGANALAQAEIYTNFNMIPYDTRKPLNPSGIRLGTPALTTRGMKEKEMQTIGKIMAKVLKNISDNSILEEARKTVKELTNTFPLYSDL